METARCKAFLYAAETGSITKAAEELSYTPSGVSQLIQAFENEIGAQLLHRNKRGVTLTEEGKRFMPAVRELLHHEAAIEQLAAEVRGLAVGTVNIAAYSSIATHWLPAVIKEFQRQYPGIEIHLHEGIRQEVEKLLASRKADMAFMSYKEPMTFEWIPLAEDPMLAVLYKEHPFAKRKKYPLKACEQEVFIMPAQGLDEDVTNMIRENDLTLQIGFKTHENFSAIAMIEQGLGMSIMNKLITDRLDYDVIMIPVDPPQYITFGVAIPALEHATPAARKFVEMAVAMLKTN
jgi:DNA-binding transcriptional LysR family regulator